MHCGACVVCCVYRLGRPGRTGIVPGPDAMVRDPGEELAGRREECCQGILVLPGRTREEGTVLPGRTEERRDWFAEVCCDGLAEDSTAGGASEALRCWRQCKVRCVRIWGGGGRIGDRYEGLFERIDFKPLSVELSLQSFSAGTTQTYIEAQDSHEAGRGGKKEHRRKRVT